MHVLLKNWSKIYLSEVFLISQAVTEHSQQRIFGDRTYSLYNISAYPHHAFPIDIRAKYESRLELPADNSPTLVTFVLFVH